MSLYTDFFPAGGGSGTGGGALAEVEIFTSSGIWTVPQSVQDEITAEGSAEVGLFMVGGGATNDSGEIVNELYKLTAADYDPILITVATTTSSGATSIPVNALSESVLNGTFIYASVTYTITAGATAATSITFSPALNTTVSAGDQLSAKITAPTTPKITVQVGLAGSDSGITASPNAIVPQTQTYGTFTMTPSDIQSANTQVTSLLNPSLIKKDSNGYPAFRSITMNTPTGPQTCTPWNTTMTRELLPNNSGYTNGDPGFSNPTLSGGLSPSTSSMNYATGEFGYATGGYIHYYNGAGPVYWGGTQISHSNVDTVTLSFPASNKTLWSTAVGGSVPNFDLNFTVVYEPNAAVVKLARSGAYATPNEFVNLSTSTEGYFGGFGRFNGIAPNSGSGGGTPQAGQVRIYYS